MVLGSSINEALVWAQQEGNLVPPTAHLIKEALAHKDQPFNSECAYQGDRVENQGDWAMQSVRCEVLRSKSLQ